MDARSLRRSFLVSAALTMCLAAPVWCQTGSITGVVEDQNGVAVPYANVILKNSTLGARANEYGAYRIIHVPVGTSVVATRILGFSPSERVNVRVGNHEEVRVDFKITPVEVRIQMTGPGCELHTAKPQSRCWVPPTPSPELNTSSWKRFEYGAFSLLLPPEFHKRKGREIDPEVLEFSSSSSPTWFTVYWGIYADPLDKSERYQRYATTSEWIGGMRAKLITAEWKGNGGVPDSGCVAAAAWRDVTPDRNLTLSGYARNQLGMKQLLAILRTVRFDEDRNGAPGDD